MCKFSLPTKIIPAEIRRLKTSERFLIDMRNPPLKSILR